MNGLVVITTYFNPCGYSSRRHNYDLFIAGMRRAGVTCITVECAFGEEPFELPASLDVIQVRARTLLWQKERLLNLAASWLPGNCRYVAWLDCDILFDNRSWVGDLVRVLREYPVAQVFESCLRLEHGNVEGAVADVAHSFAAVMRRQPDSLDAGRYDLHGHTGYGWAMRREIFDEVGLYECAVSGSADHFMAHAIFGDYNFCIRNALKHDPRQIDHLKAWGRRFHQRVQGRLGVVPGRIRHLWHGDAVNRRYFLRMHDITDLGFDPWTDLQIVPGAPLEWAAGMDKPGLRQYFANYFASRHEDGFQAFEENPA
ncbi:hypothetical protein HX867_12805 [Pseudomonas gingeri]|uniref:hypothetical protein n=1 Tax=Pseudomonas gingeri TaxID=117681 RepID=UPI0015A2A29E|nr:hypothetical protein [Pseudomonas gingeri]NVZ62964.1 hypothetical protein [Pseudomonas gingeri]NVZ77453.1 hypothetical protein [Pseudomonas gingeri]